MNATTLAVILNGFGDFFTVWAPFLLPVVVAFLLASPTRTIYRRALTNAGHRAARRSTSRVA